MAKLRAEINVTCGARSDFRREDLRTMSYLQSVLNESMLKNSSTKKELNSLALRLYPPVPVNSRTAVRSTVLPRGGGPDGKFPILIPKGSTVAFSIYAMHRRPDLYGMDAELFRPERWQEEVNPKSLKWGYLPFLGGPRTCLGSECITIHCAVSIRTKHTFRIVDFALAEAGFTIVRLLQSFPVIKLPEGEKVELVGTERQKMTLVISIKDGCKVETQS